jgi:hypothetical protein
VLKFGSAFAGSCLVEGRAGTRARSSTTATDKVQQLVGSIGELRTDRIRASAVSCGSGALHWFDPLLVRQHVASEELGRMQQLDKRHVEPEEEVYLIATAWVDTWLVRQGCDTLRGNCFVSRGVF